MNSLIVTLARLGRLNPAIWDFIVPRGPVAAGQARAFSKGSEVELNPQPIPPGRQLLLAAAMTARDLANAAVTAEALGIDPASVLDEAIDDWCGTKPRPGFPIPWPRPWPFPWPPDPDPGTDWDVAGMRVVGALTLAAEASRLGDGRAQEGLSKGAERLLEVGLSA